MKLVKCLLFCFISSILLITGCSSGKKNLGGTSEITSKEAKLAFVKIPGKDIEMSTTEITQSFYESVMGENPSYFKGEYNPVENITWYRAVYFCNKLSELYGLKPAYSAISKSKSEKVTDWSTTNIDDLRTTDINDWNDAFKEYPVPFMYGDNKKFNEYNTWYQVYNRYPQSVKLNPDANGFRLPTREEWMYAVQGGELKAFAGSNDVNDTTWYSFNSKNKTHPVAEKKPNGYGLYDMFGNVWEWTNDYDDYYQKMYVAGGDINAYEHNFDDASYIKHPLHKIPVYTEEEKEFCKAKDIKTELNESLIGFRIVRKATDK